MELTTKTKNLTLLVALVCTVLGMHGLLSVLIVLRRFLPSFFFQFSHLFVFITGVPTNSTKLMVGQQRTQLIQSLFAILTPQPIPIGSLFKTTFTAQDIHGNNVAIVQPYGTSGGR